MKPGQQTLDRRARSHPAYAAWLMHRVSGLALALFLPVHFTLLAQALHGADGLDRALALTHSPLVKVAEWGLVVLLALHLTGGVRLLLIEFLPWQGPRARWIAGGAGLALAVGLAFALALVG
jgi:fumarate reductase subunit D